MKIRYSADTDTLWIELRDTEVVKTRDLDDETLVDVDATGQVCAIRWSMRRPGSTFRA
jgi:uncharacterized protein YuzE